MFNNKTNKIDCKSTKCSIIGSFDVDVHFNWFKYCYLKREIRINQHLVSHTISILLWYLNLFNWTWIETGVISFAKSENLLIYFISSFCFFRNVNNVHLFEILWLEFPRKDSLSLLETRNCVLMNSMNCIFFFKYELHIKIASLQSRHLSKSKHVSFFGWPSAFDSGKLRTIQIFVYLVELTFFRD